MSLGILRQHLIHLRAELPQPDTGRACRTTLEQLSSGSRLNTGADDAAGLAVVSGLKANEAALTQSAQNATNGIGLAADGGQLARSGNEPAHSRRNPGHGSGERNFERQTQVPAPPTQSTPTS